MPTQFLRSWYVLFMQLPLSAALFAAQDYALLTSLWRAWSPGYVPPDDELASVKQTFRAPGVTRAAIAYYRNMLASPLAPSVRDARSLLSLRIEAPTLALTGANDGCIDTETFAPTFHEGLFKELIVERIDGAGHFLHQEVPDVINARLLAWLAQHGR